MSGASGVSMQLQLRGQQDVFLLSPNGVSFFQTDIRRHTNFASAEQAEIPCATAALGSRGIPIKISRAGDLLHQVYASAMFDAIIPDTPSEYSSQANYVSWINGLGYAMIDNIDLNIGNKKFDGFNGKFMFMRDRMEHPKSKQLNQAVGYYDSRPDRAVASQQPQELTVPLPFWFCKHSQQMLPCVGIYASDIKFIVDLASESSLLYTWGDGYSSGYTNAGMSNFHLVCNYFWVDDLERDMFTDKIIEYVFVQHQSLGTNTWDTDTTNFKRIEITFSHPVIDLTWGPYGGAATTADWNSALCFDGVSYNAFSGGDVLVQEPYKNMTMYFSNNQRTDTLTATYLRQIPHYQSSACIPDASLGQRIGTYSFAINNNTLQPCGSANFSGYERARMDFGVWNSGDSDGYIYPTTDTWQTACTIEIHARNFNLAKKALGQMQVKWA